jgi:predicted nucleic acid-binding protein
MEKARRVFVDTNLFLRYLTNDVPEQAEAFERLARQAAAGSVTLIFIDAYNAAWMLAEGIDTGCTFDRRHFARLEGITVEVPAGTLS